ncbi:hypothetical protein AAH450_16535 [Erwinia sp. P7711]|uniref:hypothetical protein n=1 Tax=Erwinia sp. P7711 TaxID=3141451 RepID=UPI003190853E
MFPALPLTSAQVKRSDPQTVKLWEALPGRHRGETVLVSPELMNELNIAQNVIDVVKDNLVHGTGNQKTDYMLSRGQSYYHAVAARHLRDVDFRGDDGAIVKSGQAARGGTCGEQSALAMAYLSNMDLTRPVYTYAVENHRDHQLNVIGDLREPRRAVVVDPWPIFARAHLVDNAALRPDINRLLDVHLPGSDPKIELDELADVKLVDEKRIAHINQQKQIPTYHQVLENPGSVRLEGRTHGIRNAGVRYQNRENAAEVLENIADRAVYERQAMAMQQARRYFPEGDDS